MTNDPTRATAIVDWLLGDARLLAGGTALLEGLCARLTAAGLPLWRCTLHLPQLNPQLAGLSYVWLSDGVEAQEQRIPRQLLMSQTYHHSPIALMHRTGSRVRRRLAGPDADIDFPVLEELRDQGATDYLLLPMRSIQGRVAGIGLSTRDPAGFSEADFALFDAVTPALGAIADLLMARLTGRGLLEAYLGHDTAGRILAGQVTLGHAISLDAAILFTDLRDYTSLSEQLSKELIIGLLNDYFGAMVRGVQRARGEILKFIGDGLLAIFPRLEGETLDFACARALSGTREAVAELEAINAGREQAGVPPARVGMALHVGTVYYGNIGAEERLDFTVIGPAVNRAARIGALCRLLGEPALASKRFAKACPLPLRSLGRHLLRGIDKPQELFSFAA